MTATDELPPPVRPPGTAARPKEDLRLRLAADGFGVELHCRDGGWAVFDEDSVAAELALLEKLGRPSETLERARGVAAALNAGLISPDDTGTWTRRLAVLPARRSHRYSKLRRNERDALTVMCAQLGSDAAWEFLAWVLAKRLEPSLRRTPWMPPGRHSWTVDTHWEFDETLVQRLGTGFFDAMAAHPDVRFRDLAVATDPEASPDLVEELIDHRDQTIRDLVAVNPSTPLEALEYLSCRKRPFCLDEIRVRLRVLQNPSTPAGVVDAAATAPVDDDYIDQPWPNGSTAAIQKIWAVRHPCAPRRLLRDLASRGDSRVRVVIGQLTRSPARVLEALAHDLTTEVRAAVAGNPSTPAPLLDSLGGDAHRAVRAAVATNPRTGPSLLERLAVDAVPEVRRAAAAACMGATSIPTGARGETP